MGDKKTSIWDDWVTPDLARNPALASDVYSSGQPKVLAPVVSYANKGVTVQDAINDHAAANGTDGFWNKLGGGLMSGLSWLGKPLQEIQKDYKFIHAVYTDHGFLQGFATTLGVIGGGVGGGIVGGPLGAVVGADIAATGLRQLSQVGPLKDKYKDAYAKSEDPNYIVSPGRDFSNALSKATSALGFDGASKVFKDTNAGLGKVISGTSDFAFDVTADPIQVVGRFAQLTKAGKFLGLSKAGEIELKYPIMDTVPGVKQFLIERSKVPLTSEQMDAVRAGSGIFNSTSRVYNRALEDIAKSTAGEIIQKYPTLGTVAAGRLGAIDTAEGVHDFLKTSLYFGELEGSIAGQAMIPTRTLLRSKFGDSKVVDYLRNDGSLPGKIYKTFSGYMPYSVDPETMKLSLSKFRWDANDAATVIYRIARFGMGDEGAKAMATKYAEAVAAGGKDALATARAIKNQTLFETFKALGLPDDLPFVKSVADDINKINVENVSTQIYGVNVLGEPLGEYMTTNGPRTGALVKHQATDMFDIPDFFAIKKAMRDAGKYTKYIGSIDEFVAKRYTNTIFKPLALATAGFGLRIAASEMIPTFARFGIMNTMKAKLAVSAAKQNYDLIPKEGNSVISAALVALGAHTGISPDVFKYGFPAFQEAKRRGLNFAAKMLPDDQIELAQKLILANNGHFLSDAVTTGHGYDASTSYQAGQAAHYYFQIQKNSPYFRELPEYTTYSPSDIHYAPRLVTTLNKASTDAAYKNISADLASIGGNFAKGGKFQIMDDVTKMADHQKFLDLRNQLIDREYKRMMDAVAGKYKGYDKELKVVTRWQDAVRDGSLRQFAADRVDSLMGMVVGKDGTFHNSLALGIARGKEVDPDEVINLVRSFPQSVPAGVSGPALQPYIPTTTFLEKIVNLGFKKVIDPIVNGLAREPLYMMHVADAYQRLVPEVLAGRMLDDQALRIAQVQGSYSMIPQIHNTALRNQFSQYVRNVLPFYFAQEQALKRAYNTLKDTSVASPLFSRGLRFFQIAEHAVNDPTFVQEDSNGNRYIYFPVVGAFGQGLQNALAAYGVPIVSGLPLTARGSLISLKTVLPELQMPGVSPIAAISANLVSDFFPVTSPVIRKAVGEISFKRAILDTIVPATWAKTALEALTPLEFQNQMGNAMAAALAAAYYHGQVPGPDSTDMDRQNFVERIKNNARSVLLLKTFLNLTSPLAPQVSQEDAGFRDEFWKLVKEKGNYADALMEFMGKHGDRVVSYTVAKTQSNVPGAKYPYIQETVDFIRENKNLFNYKSGVSTGAFWLIPQDNSKNESDRAVFAELMNMHLRSERTPTELLKQFYIAQGDAIMAPLIKEHVTILNQAQANYDTYTKQQETARWSAIMNKMKNLHPIWYADYTNPEGSKNAQTAYNQLQLIFSRPDAPTHEQAQMVKALMSDYQKHADIMAQYKSLNLQGPLNQAEKQNWENYLLRLSESEPRLKPVIDSVFRKLG